MKHIPEIFETMKEKRDLKRNLQAEHKKGVASNSDKTGERRREKTKIVYEMITLESSRVEICMQRIRTTVEIRCEQIIFIAYTIQFVSRPLCAMSERECGRTENSNVFGLQNMHEM